MPRQKHPHTAFPRIFQCSLAGFSWIALHGKLGKTTLAHPRFSKFCGSTTWAEPWGVLGVARSPCTKGTHTRFIEWITVTPYFKHLYTGIGAHIFWCKASKITWHTPKAEGRRPSKRQQSNQTKFRKEHQLLGFQHVVLMVRMWMMMRLYDVMLVSNTQQPIWTSSIGPRISKHE